LALVIDLIEEEGGELTGGNIFSEDITQIMNLTLC